MDSTAAPQLIEHILQPLTFTPFDVKWLPKSAKLAVLGQVGPLPSSRLTLAPQSHRYLEGF